MDEIKKTNFDTKKGELKKFADGQRKSIQLSEFEDKFLHRKVKAGDMNAFVSDLQKVLIEFNSSDRKIIKEFQQVYETFDYLDKEYINGILLNIKALEETYKKITESNKGKFSEAARRIALNKEKYLELARLTDFLESRVGEHNESINYIKSCLDKFEETNILHEEELLRQAHKDEEHDYAIEEGIKKDKEQDRMLEFQRKKDSEHDAAIQRGEEKDKSQDIIIDEQRALNILQEERINALQHENDTLYREMKQMQRIQRRRKTNTKRGYRR